MLKLQPHLTIAQPQGILRWDTLLESHLNMPWDCAKVRVRLYIYQGPLDQSSLRSRDANMVSAVTFVFKDGCPFGC
jgi:hypothetical protein